MKHILFATLIALSLVGNAMAAETAKKAEKTEAPATPKEMPKVDKPKTKKEKLEDCLAEKKEEASVCEKRYGKKEKK